MHPIFLFLGALSALTGILMGAFGAHGLKTVISPELLAVYQTGASYQMYHSLGLIGISLIPDNAKVLAWAGWLMFIGIILFSGSLYLLAIFNLHHLGAITPIGGVCFLIAWALIALFAAKNIRSFAHHSR